MTWNSCGVGVYMSFLTHGHSLEMLPCPYSCLLEMQRERFSFHGKTGCLVLRYTRLLCTCSPRNNRHALPSGKLHAPISPVIYERSESIIMSIHLNHRLSPHLCALRSTRVLQGSHKAGRGWGELSMGPQTVLGGGTGS